MEAALRAILKETTSLPPVLEKAQKAAKFTGKCNLYTALRYLPNNGVGARVVQKRWVDKKYRNTYVEITKVKLKTDDLSHGKAWGVERFWGKSDGKEKRVTGALKHQWAVLSQTPSVLSILPDTQASKTQEEASSEGSA